MKNSNKLILGLLLLLFALPFLYAFLLKQKLDTIDPLSKFMKSPFESLHEYPMELGSFSYLVSDDVPVTVDTGQWQVTLNTYKEHQDFCSIKVQNDTLYISKAPEVRAISEPWISVNVKLPKLKGLKVINGGSIESKNPDTHFEASHVALEVGEGGIRLPLKARSLELAFRNKGSAVLSGEVGRIDVNGHTSSGSLLAFNLRADTAYVRNAGQGTFQLHVEQYLEADLLGGSGDVVYRGQPVVAKKESRRGRVIQDK